MDNTTISVHQHVGEVGEGAQVTGVELVVRGLGDLPTCYDGRVKSFLEYYLGTPDRPVPFGGRAADLAALDAWLADPQAPRYALMVAPAGRGKSALLAHWVTGLAARPDSVHVVYFPISVRFNTNLETVAFASLAARMAHLYGEKMTQAVDAQQYRGVFSDYLRRPPPDGRGVLVVLDGLDEAAGWQVGADLFPLGLPEHVRVVVAARPLAGDATESDWLGRLGWTAPGLARAWPLDRLDRVGVSDVLAQMGQPLAALVTRRDIVGKLYELSEGDPLLVRLYVDALSEKGEQAALFEPKDLATLEPGLGGYLKLWFEEQHRLWGADQPLKDKSVRGLLNLCATALGPLKGADVLALAPDYFEDSLLAAEAVRALHRLVIGDGETSGYVFSHPRLGEYFGGRLAPAEHKAWRGRFLKYGQDTLAGLTAKALLPRDASAYAVQYYGAHLKVAEAPADSVYTLVCEGWLRAWEAMEGTPAGFLNDVRGAWERAEAEGPAALGQQIRAALCFSSVASVSANIGLELLLACLKAGVLNPRLALVMARGKPGAWERATCLAEMSPFLPPEERGAVLAEALSAARAVGTEDARARALSAVAGRLPPEERELLAKALSAARAVGDEKHRAQALSAVAERLPPEEQEAVLAEALSAARAVGTECFRTWALEAVAERLPPEAADLRRQLLQFVRLLTHQHSSAQILTYIVPQWQEMCRLGGRSELDELTETLRAFATAERENMLGAIEALLPVIAGLGSERAVRETAQAIVDTARWWP